jgi:hypothetical protein
MGVSVLWSTFNLNPRQSNSGILQSLVFVPSFHDPTFPALLHLLFGFLLWYFVKNSCEVYNYSATPHIWPKAEGGYLSEGTLSHAITR